MQLIFECRSIHTTKKKKMNIIYKSLNSYFQNRLSVSFSINTSPRFTQYARTFLETQKPVVAMDESLTGHYKATLVNKGKKITHQGIKISVVGEFRSFKNEVYSQFFQRTFAIMPPGEITEDFEGDFTFDDLKLPTATYYGDAIQAVYAVQFIIKKITERVVNEKQFYVVGFDVKEPQAFFKDEIGIPDLLHMEILMPNKYYETNDVIIGKVFFITLKLKIVSINISIIHQEYYEDDKIIIRNENVLTSYEILDGSPVRGDGIPFRIYLSGCNLKWYLNFSGSKLMSRIFAKITVWDASGEKYTKQIKIYFVRNEPDNIIQDAPEQ